jgi:hypothetical protein
MSPPPRRPGDRVGLLLDHGAQAGRALALGQPSGTDGWWAAAQAAADLSGQDDDVLRICDELFAAAADLRTPAAVRAYARSTRAVVESAAAETFLRGMHSGA